jgi:hypothetical protein
MPFRFRRGLAFALAAAMLPVLSACSASFGAATQEPYAPADGVQVDSGSLKLRNLVLVVTATNQATLVGTIFNEGSEPDALVSVTAGSAAGKLTPTTIPVPANGSAVLGQQTTLGTASTVELSGESLRPGLVTRVTFDFQRAASVSADVIIEPRVGPYADVPLPPSPTPTPEPTLDIPHTESPSPEPSETATAEASQ